MSSNSLQSSGQLRGAADSVHRFQWVYRWQWTVNVCYKSQVKDFSLQTSCDVFICDINTKSTLIHRLKWFEDPGGCMHMKHICIIQQSHHTGLWHFPPTHHCLCWPLTHIASQMQTGYLFCTHQILCGLLLHWLPPRGTGLTWKKGWERSIICLYEAVIVVLHCIESFCTGILFTHKTACHYCGKLTNHKVKVMSFG